MFFFTCTSMALAGAPSAVELKTAWARHENEMHAHAAHRITLFDDDFKHVASGEIAKRRIHEDGPDRAMGLMWTPIDRNRVWVAVLDDIHDTVVSNLVERRLGRSEAGRKQLYQRLSLPWPLTDRQWVIEIWNNTELAHATTGSIWERPWDLAAQDLMPEPDPEAIWVPMINGSWFLLEVGGGTLVVYSARTTIGGSIPSDLVTRWALSTLDEMLEHITERAAVIDAHYTPDHEPVMGGDNAPVPFMSSDVQPSPLP